MSEPRIARLARRGVVAVGGADATAFLNDLVTADVGAASPSQAVYAGLLTPQGKVLFDFIVFRDGEGFLFDLPRASVADFVKRLALYRLRAKVTIDDRSAGLSVWAAWGDEEPSIDGVVAPDPRLRALGWRAIAGTDADPTSPHTAASEADYDAHRIVLGVPEGAVDYTFGEAFPHDADMDQLGGIDFGKGCFVGQEVVSRMEHRGTARRRVVIARGIGPLPPAGTAITAGERPIGTMMSSAGESGLAMVRLDRVGAAIDNGVPIAAGETVLTLAIPAWARFAGPAADVGD